MQTSIPISYLNDFIFCPRSIYFHQLYGKAKRFTYQQKPQLDGEAAHKSVDTQTYSTSKNVLQGIEVYSEKYQIHGKIDQFDAQKGVLIERKKFIKVIYDGYVFQLYAQYFGLSEMGYQAKELRFYSMQDNKVYPVHLPKEDKDMFNKFEKVIDDLHHFDMQAPFQQNIKKCNNCIYNQLCDHSPC